ncbi:MAG TPA: S-methyl-5-thioribose-1-phosphate isomerase [Candidatus Bathyarchaeia archaeon]|nr:S-methyl-5-thioribose-1-phosphate isomerase [Candidatus Bathyarchaeia archaeon]
MRTIEWRDGVVVTLDQTRLPLKEAYLKLRTESDVAKAIKDMRIRGAPLIGAAAAFGLALTAYHSESPTRGELMRELEASAALIRSSRPTAVNLSWAIERVMNRARASQGSAKETSIAVIEEASRIADEDVEANRAIGQHGKSLIQDGDTVLTHCNAGALATVDYGTALGIVRASVEEGKNVRVMATETRPYLQGSRLTAYELARDNIPVTLIVDGAVGYMMWKGLVNKVVVGADRIVRDAVINKVGTHTIAVLAKEYRVPFYVAAPTSTFDVERASSQVTLEERNGKEITHFMNIRVAPENVAVINPAFDITPLDLVTAIVTEKGVLRPPYEKAFKILSYV